jgi:hypothetical protein
MQFDQRLAAMPACFRRTEFLYDVLAARPVIRVIRHGPRPACRMCTCR